MTLRSILTFLAALVIPLAGTTHGTRATQPAAETSVILIMMDDLGWGDAGYQGHPVLQTPNLDAMARTGIRFDRFYAAAPVCSPTRASVLTGRHPYRCGITSANVGHLPEQERTLAEILRERGYRTGHFGKWHLGTLTETQRDSNRGGPRGAEHYAPPWAHGFDECFSTEARIPTYDPMTTPPKSAGGVTADQTPGEPFGTAYWTGPGQQATENLEGDNSRIIMDRAIPFIERAVEQGQPFFVVIWLHTPHLPVVASERHRARYVDSPEFEQHYFGCITAADEQIGRLRARLRDLGAADDTMLFFCSDNGPEGQAGSAPGSAGDLRGRKRSLYEGGVRVPGLLEWPRRVREPRVITAPCSTLDSFPTVLDALGFVDPGRIAPLDGRSLMPLILGREAERGRPLGFQAGRQASWVEDQFKLILTRSDDGERVELFDLRADVAERTNLANRHPDIAERMQEELARWRASCAHSATGADYRESLPRVLLLGDSISMGYHSFVVDELMNNAIVVRPRENCAGTTNGVRKINDWLKLHGGEFDVIHFNFGLHDLKRVKVAGGNAASNDPSDPHQADLAAYERNLRRIVSALCETDAKLIFATTTPVPGGGVRPHRDPEDVARYNAAAAKIMSEHGIEVNDLCALAEPKLAEMQQPVNVHFTYKGSRQLGEEVTRHIRAALQRSAGSRSAGD